MRIISLILGLGFVLTFLSLGISSNKVIGQITSSSSGSPAISLSNNFSGNWKARVERVKPTSSSSSGSLETSSSSSSGRGITLEAHVKSHEAEDHGGKSENKGSSTISLKLCVENGQLKGTIHQGGFLDKANIISQQILSENSVLVDLQDKKGVTKKATLELSGNNLKIIFDNGIIANGRKLNRQGCVRPKSSPSSSSGSITEDNDGNSMSGMSGQGMSSKPEDDNTESSPSPVNSPSGMSSMSEKS